MNVNVRPLAAAILKSGILSDQAINEFRRWGFPFEEGANTASLSSCGAIVDSLEEALQSEGLVIERITDVDLLRQYMLTVKLGTLHLEEKEGGRSADFQIPYGRTALGEIIIPWKGDIISDEIINGVSYLELSSSEGNKKIYFSSVQEFFFDEQKAFMICS